MDRKRAHLLMIRAIINRMSVGSFLIKGWSIVTVSALLAVATDVTHARFAWLALFMAIAFWMLDAHFTRQQRLFRKTYERVQSQAESEIDYRLDTSPVDSDAVAWGSILLSKALGGFHLTVVALITVILVVF